MPVILAGIGRQDNRDYGSGQDQHKDLATAVSHWLSNIQHPGNLNSHRVTSGDLNMDGNTSMLCLRWRCAKEAR